MKKGMQPAAPHPRQVAAGTQQQADWGRPPTGASSAPVKAPPRTAPPPASPQTHGRLVSARASVLPTTAPSKAKRSGLDDAARQCVLAGAEGMLQVCVKKARVGKHLPVTP